MPLAACCIPRVAMKAGTLQLPTKKALTTLQATATETATTRATAMEPVLL